MKKTILICICFTGIFNLSDAQIAIHYDPSLQRTHNLQYFTPSGRGVDSANLFVGDCIPFFDKGIFYLYWLIDSSHHAALGGLGGHQWVLSTTADLKTWKHYPVVIGLDESWEKSICTGSVVKKGNLFYAFYATRVVKNGVKQEQLSYAVSKDGIHFDKQLPNPFFAAPAGYGNRDFRDPKAIIDDRGNFHLFIAGSQEQPALQGEDGCLVHLMSANVKDWSVQPTLLSGQPAVPECPDHFFWKGWYYLLYSNNSNTSYLKSRKPYGPWQYPHSQALDEEWSNVVKTAAFKGDRWIAVGWIPSRQDNKDGGNERFGGNMVFRELGQEKDGDLTTKFPPEMIRATGQRLVLPVVVEPGARKMVAGDLEIQSADGIALAHMDKLPADCRITLEIDPYGNNEETGIYLRSFAKGAGGYKLSFSADKRRACLGNTCIEGVTGLDGPIRLDVIMSNDILDISINGKRCIVNRAPEQKGDYLWLYVKHGKATFRSITIRPLLP